MKIRFKLISGFLIISLIVGLVGGISLLQLNKMSNPLNKEIPETIEMIKTTSHLDGLAQFIRYYDEVLTQSARNYAFTENKKWGKRYRETEPKLDRIIKEAIRLGDGEDKKFFLSIDYANVTLVDMEYKSIELINNGHAEEAIKILNSSEYWRQKNIYEQGLKNYILKRGSQYDKALAASTETINSVSINTQNLLKESKLIILILLIGSLILAVGIGAFASYSISSPLTKLRENVVEIGKGKLDTPIEIMSKDEVGDLAIAFKQMSKDLLEITASRNELNKEITERKKMEKKLLKSEKRFHTAAICTADLIWEGDIRSNSLRWFGDIDGKLGYEDGEFPRTINGHMESVHPEDRDNVSKAIQKSIESGRKLSVEYRMKCKQGIYHYWHESGKAIEFENNKAVKWVGSVTDITARKIAEDNLLESLTV